MIVPSQPEFDVDAVLRHAAARLADYKVPQFVAIREEPLARNAAGKVVKDQLRQQVDMGEVAAMSTEQRADDDDVVPGVAGGGLNAVLASSSPSSGPSVPFHAHEV